MPTPQQSTNTAEFTSALKKVYNIHKNIVAELCAQLDVVTSECKLLKADSHIPKSSGKCESCIHLEKMNRSLQEHFNSLLHEKDVGIKALEKKLQILTGSTNTVSSQTHKEKMLPNEMPYTVAAQEFMLVGEQALSPKISDTSRHAFSSNDVDAAPLNPHSQRQIMNLSDTELAKGHSKLRLTRGKRHSRYIEEQRETKRLKISPSAAAKSDRSSDYNLESKENNLSGFDDTIFVADTVGITQHLNFKPTHKPVDIVSDNEQSQQCLVVPETIDTSFNSLSELEAQLEKLDDNDNTRRVIGFAERNCHSESAKGFLNIIPGHDKGSRLGENITLLSDDDDTGNSNADSTCVIPGRKRADSNKQILKEPTRKSSFQVENGYESVFQQSVYDRKVRSEESGDKISLRNFINPKEDKTGVNDVTIINEGFSHRTEVTENVSGSISTLKQNCHILRKNSNALVKNAAKQKESQKAVCDLKINSLGQDHNVGKMKAHLTPSKSIQQTTLSQTFTDKYRVTGKHETRSSQRKVGLAPTEEAEKLQIAEAIQRSLKDFHNSQSSFKRSETKSLESNFQVSSPERESAEIKNARKCISTSEEKVPNTSPDLKTKNVQKCISASKEEVPNTSPELKTKNVQKCISASEEKVPKTSPELKTKNVQKCISASEEKVPKTSPELKTKNVRKCISTNESKEIASGKLERSSNMAQLLPLSVQSPLDRKTQEQEETTDTTESTERKRQLLNSANTDLNNDKISSFAALEPNGSLNPEVHLTEYLYSEVTEGLNINQTFCGLDETIAPNLISQYVAGSQQFPDTSQITKLNTEANRHIEIQQDGSELDGLQDDDDDDDCILNNTVFSTDEDDPETIEPSPQQTFQSRSQLYSSIPASSNSYKFINKKPHNATRSLLQGIGESEMVNNEDSVMDESRHLLHDKSGLNLDGSTVLNMNYNSPPQEHLDSFDRVPKSEGIEFPHVSVVRKRSERNKLEGFSCKQCYEYYKNSGLSEEALQQKKNDCSRHRERYRAPETPEHFWSLGFPDTAEMIERGQRYNSKESPVAANRAPRRRQRLEKKF